MDFCLTLLWHTGRDQWILQCATPIYLEGFILNCHRQWYDGSATLDLVVITARCSPENIASWRVMEMIGMHRTPEAEPAALEYLDYSISCPNMGKHSTH
jgi:hypothetical protein